MNLTNQFQSWCIFKFFKKKKRKKGTKNKTPTVCDELQNDFQRFASSQHNRMAIRNYVTRRLIHMNLYDLIHTI